MSGWKNVSSGLGIDAIVLELDNVYAESRVIFEKLEANGSQSLAWEVARYLDSIGHFQSAYELRKAWFDWATEKAYHGGPKRPSEMRDALNKMAK